MHKAYLLVQVLLIDHRVTSYVIDILDEIGVPVQQILERINIARQASRTCAVLGRQLI